MLHVPFIYTVDSDFVLFFYFQYNCKHTVCGVIFFVHEMKILDENDV